MAEPAKKGPPGLGLLIGIGKPPSKGADSGEEEMVAEESAEEVAASEFASALKSGDGATIYEAFKTLCDACGIEMGVDYEEEEPEVEVAEEEF